MEPMKNLRFFVSCLAAAGLVAGCGSSDNNDNTDGGPAFSLFTPATQSQVPLPINLFFIDQTNSGPTGPLVADTTLNIPNATNSALVDDTNRIDGFSTTSSIFTDFLGSTIDSASYADGIHVFKIAPSFQELVQGMDYDVRPSTVITTRPRLLIQPLRPLDPGSTYAVVLTDSLRTVSGGPVIPGEEFLITASPNDVGSDENPATRFNATQQATLAQIRAGLIRPIFNGLIAPPTGPDPTPGIDPDNVVLTWSFTTQSVGESLRYLANNPTPGPIGIAPAPDGMGGQLSTGEAIPGADDTADIFVGSVTLPYYLEAPADANDDVVLSTFWASNGTVAGGGATSSSLQAPGTSGFIPCGAFSPSESTSKCFPQPMQRSNQTIPVLVTVPNASSGQTMPAEGWPVVIALHGITGNRTQMLAIAPALASEGFVVVAIDQPLHGLPPGSLSRVPGVPERTFDLDLVNNMTGAPGPDSMVDASGTHFINIPSIISSRDNLRQSAADIINLNATLRAADLALVDATGAPTGSLINLDNTNTHFFGHSLGGIVGATVAGVTNGELGAVALANPGGGVLGLLDGSAAFGPRISAGTAAAGAPEGGDTYETLLRFGQTVVDTTDPVNLAAAAAAAHDIYMIEVTGNLQSGGTNPPDLVVPNFVVRNAPAAGPCPMPSSMFLPFLDVVCEGRPLSGTDPLIAGMGLNTVEISPPYAMGDAQPVDTAVRFTAGDHSSILSSASVTPGVDATAAAQTNCEMQRQTATFLAQAAAGSAAPMIPIGPATCP